MVQDIRNGDTATTSEELRNRMIIIDIRLAIHMWEDYRISDRQLIDRVNRIFSSVKTLVQTGLAS